MKSDKSRLLKNLLKDIYNGIHHLIWPASCLNCRLPLSSNDILCSDCFYELTSLTGGQYCRRCGRDGSGYGRLDGFCPACQQEDIEFDGIARCGIYASPLREMILSFKNGRTELASSFGFLLNSSLQGSSFSGQIDYLVPVPLHWTRRLKRGFNQSHLLAARLGNGNLTINTDLVRIRRTKRQTDFTSPAARAENVAGAFAIRKDHRLSGKTACLIDDIKTTGATLNECAATLKDAGVSKVYALVLAVAGQDAG